MITAFGFPEHTWMVIEIGAFLAGEGRFEGYGDCGWFGPFPESCAGIQLENLDAWAEWRENVEPADAVGVALASWYGGDCEAALFVAGPVFTEAVPKVDCPASSSTAQTIEYESILGAQASVENCETTSTGSDVTDLTCEVHYSNAMNSAVGKPPAVTTRPFAVWVGLVRGPEEEDQLWFTVDYPEDTELRASFGRFAAGGGLPDEYQDEYVDADCATARTPVCANLILNNLDTWAAWYETGNS